MKPRLRYRIPQLLTRLLGRIFFGYVVSGVENVPRTGACILAANHKSYMDPPIVGAWLEREIGYFAKKELFRIPLFGRAIRDWGSIPVDRGGSDRKALTLALQTLRSGKALLLFPEGTRIRRAALARPKEGVAMLADKTGLPVVPVYVGRTWEPRRTLFRRIPIRVIYGRPLDLSVAASEPVRKQRYARISAEVMESIRLLAESVGDRLVLESLPEGIAQPPDPTA